MNVARKNRPQSSLSIASLKIALPIMSKSARAIAKASLSLVEIMSMNSRSASVRQEPIKTEKATKMTVMASAMVLIAIK